MDMSARPLIALATGFLVITLAAPGCDKKEPPPTQGGSSADGGKKDPAPQALGKPDFTVTPAEWKAEFKKDPEAAKAKYKDKVVEMSGTVSSVRPDPYGEVGRVDLEVPNDAYGVECLLADKKPWTKVSPGSKVKVRGKLWDRFSGVLNPCQIVEAGPNPAVTVSAQDLAKQFAADRTAARKKYHDKWAYVSGEVAEKSDAEVTLKLKGEGGISVLCSFPPPYKKSLEPVKVGSKVDLFGQLWVLDGPQDKAVALRHTVLTDVK
jgi:hypothetical protein